jgi:exodeoxyribonuclease VII large subunit
MESMTEHVYTPTELNREVKLHLETGFPRILLEAEISNLARPASGHLYFTLKDNGAQVKCAMFRSSASRVNVRAENGMKVLARGRVSLYEPRGDYQFIVDGLQDAGQGILQRQFEELKKKLEAEGLFDPIHKQELPAYPSRIGLITSPSGAAVRDLLHVLQRRWPVAQVRLYAVPVQGMEAPAKIRGAIEAANCHHWAETLIIGRGGGSLEDLLAFNDEGVARAVFASDIPIISAVGHETDFSICDFVADLRAPTPSAAAELASPDQIVLREAFQRTHRQLQRRVRDRLHRDSQRLDHVNHRLQQQHPSARLTEQSRRLASTSEVFQRTMQRFLADRSARLGELARTLNAVSPLETLGRGYAIVTGGESGETVSSISQLKTGDRVSTRLKDGTFDCRVDSVRS